MRFAIKIINVMAASIDGRIALTAIEGDEQREDAGLSSEADRRHLREQVSGADGVLVGASSIRANGECLDWTTESGQHPVWIVFAKSEIPADLAFWQQTNIPRIIIAPQPIPLHGAGCRLVVTHQPAEAAVNLCSELDLKRVLLFGGGIVNSWFYEAGLVDELMLTVAPVLVGNEQAPFLLQPRLSKKIDLKLVSCESRKLFLFLRYAIVKRG